MKNQLYYGDNLDILRDHIAGESVDLIYLDPPFNSNRNYNVLFKEKSGESSPSQLEAFTDTWQWNQDAEYAYDDLTTNPPAQLASMIEAMRSFIGTNDMMAYLVMMAQRLKELHRVLKPTGSLYLHCDPTASHYLKVLLDTVFGVRNFRSEVIWKRTSAHSSAKRYGPVHDTILFYSRTDIFTWNPLFQPYDDEYRKTFFEQTDPDGRRWKRTDLTGAGTRNGPSGEPWRGIDVRAKGRHWAMLPSQLDILDQEGRIHWPQREDGMPRLKQYEDMMPGVPLQDVWHDISPMHNLSAERLGYPTQKPLTLLERMIEASSNEGDVVLDPFCGCGTAVVAAQKLNRKWIGIDITHLAVSLIRTRMIDQFGLGVEKQIEVHGEPTDLGAAHALFDHDPFQFEWWALSLVNAMPANDKKKGADKGVDGIIRFHVDTSGKTRKAVVQVKGGKVQSHYIRDLRGTMQREKADMALLVTLQEPTSAMEKEAAEAGVFTTPLGNKYPSIQIMTVEALLNGSVPRLPHAIDTFAKANRLKAGQQTMLDLGDS